MAQPHACRHPMAYRKHWDPRCRFAAPERPSGLHHGLRNPATLFRAPLLENPSRKDQPPRVALAPLWGKCKLFPTPRKELVRCRVRWARPLTLSGSSWLRSCMATRCGLCVAPMQTTSYRRSLARCQQHPCSSWSTRSRRTTWRRRLRHTAMVAGLSSSCWRSVKHLKSGISRRPCCKMPLRSAATSLATLQSSTCCSSALRSSSTAV
mmetsp:Transcript_108226/g.279868  ORF Transcript_108226/g.279868 Transcript_108226/m.279868 type:complete len:208 (-) Transcript_108226:693-1316(-)